MRIASPVLSFLLVTPIACWTPLATAEIFKCTSADGKTNYSESPCTTAGAKEVRVPIVASPVRAPLADSKGPAIVDNVIANAAMGASAPQRGAAASSSSGAIAPTASAPGKTRAQIVAECEARRGTNCNSEDEIARRRMEDRTLTPDELAAQKTAVAGRREQEKRKAESDTKAKSQSPGSNPAPATSPAKTGH